MPLSLNWFQNKYPRHSYRSNPHLLYTFFSVFVFQRIQPYKSAFHKHMHFMQSVFLWEFVVSFNASHSLKMLLNSIAVDDTGDGKECLIALYLWHCSADDMSQEQWEKSSRQWLNVNNIFRATTVTEIQHLNVDFVLIKHYSQRQKFIW